MAFNLNTIINSMCSPQTLLECASDIKQAFDQCKDADN